MLTDAEKTAIDHELTHYADKQAACIDALKIVQRTRGYVSDAALHDLADFLHMSAAELDGVATFYSLIFRRPVGRHVILLCDSASCWMMGYERVRTALVRHLGIEGFGETSRDGRFTLLPVPCLGACDGAPVMLIDENLHRDLEPAHIERVLAEYS